MSYYVPLDYGEQPDAALTLDQLWDGMSYVRRLIEAQDAAAALSDDAGEEEACAENEADNRLRDRRDDLELEIQRRVPSDALELSIQLRLVQLTREDGWEAFSVGDGAKFLANLIAGAERLPTARAPSIARLSPLPGTDQGQSAF